MIRGRVLAVLVFDISLSCLVFIKYKISFRNNISFKLGIISVLLANTRNKCFWVIFVFGKYFYFENNLAMPS